MKSHRTTYKSLTVVGNLTLDQVSTDGSERVLPGGSAFYVSATAAFLGSSVRVISQVGPDYPHDALAWLRQRGVDVAQVRRTGTPSTRFRLTYRRGSRTLRVIQRGGRIGTISIPSPSVAVHLGPVFREISLRMVPRLRRDSAFLSADLQGFLRYEKTGGRVWLRPAKPDAVFRLFDLVKATAEEAQAQASDSGTFSAVRRLIKRGPKRLIVTMGTRGALLAEKGGKILRVPAYPEPSAFDPTGAGDAFVGGWLATFQRTGDVRWSASVGSAIASLVVRKEGQTKFRLSRKELFRRSAWVYDGIGVVSSRL